MPSIWNSKVSRDVQAECVLAKREAWGISPELLKMFLFRTTRCQSERRILTAWFGVTHRVRDYCKTCESTCGKEVETRSWSLAWLSLQDCMPHLSLILSLLFFCMVSSALTKVKIRYCRDSTSSGQKHSAERALNLTNLVQLLDVKSSACGS